MLLQKLLFLAVITFLSCNSQEASHSPHTTGEHQKALSLHKGIKLKSDLGTRRHVANLNMEIAAFEKQQIDGKGEYQELASKLQTELNGLIKDCRMKGAEHEALHSWLEPVLELVKDLKAPGSAAQKAKSVEQLKVQTQKFNQYFN